MDIEGGIGATNANVVALVALLASVATIVYIVPAHKLFATFPEIVPLGEIEYT
jgi:hypothetical protein